MTVAITWEEPPEPRLAHTAKVTGPILDALAERPGDWAHVGTAATSPLAQARAQSLRKAGVKRGVTVETATRQVAKHVRIYARLV